MYQVDGFKNLEQVHYTQFKQMLKYCKGCCYVLRDPGAEPEEPGRSKGEVHIFNIYIIDSKRFQIDPLKTLDEFITQNIAYICEMLWVGLCSKTPPPRGRTGRARSVKRGGAHLQDIYNLFQKVSG